MKRQFLCQEICGGKCFQSFRACGILYLSNNICGDWQPGDGLLSFMIPIFADDQVIRQTAGMSGLSLEFCNSWNNVVDAILSFCCKFINSLTNTSFFKFIVFDSQHVDRGEGLEM